MEVPEPLFLCQIGGRWVLRQDIVQQFCRFIDVTSVNTDEYSAQSFCQRHETVCVILRHGCDRRRVYRNNLPDGL